MDTASTGNGGLLARSADVPVPPGVPVGARGRARGVCKDKVKGIASKLGMESDAM